MEKNQQESKPNLPNDNTRNTAGENHPGADLNNTAGKQDRAGDFGASGHFAPGGYDKQQGSGKPDRVDLDEELALRRQLGDRQ